MKRHSLRARVAAAATTMGVALAGAVVLTAAPAEAKLRETDYGFQTTAYGTRVTADQVALRSARTAFSYISCTRLTGIDRQLDQDDLATVNGNDMIKVKGVESSNRTYREARKHIVGVQGTNTIAAVTLGADDGPQLMIRGLTTTAKAWARNGKFHTATDFDSLPIEVSLPGQEQPGTGTPLDDLLDQAQNGISGVLEALQENAGEIEIPGLGVLHLGYERNTVKKRFAAASTYALRISLYGADSAKGGNDDSTVSLGRAWARITRDVPAGVFHGTGYAAQIDAVDGVLKVGRVVTRPLPCAGTHGHVRQSNLALLNPGAAGQLVVNGLHARSFGIQRNGGYARGWTEGEVAGVSLGSGDTSLRLSAIVGHAQVVQTKAGRVRKSARGTTIGSITFGGERQAIPDPGQTLELPGLGELRAHVVHRTKRGIAVTAVKITLFPDTPGETVIKLGNATARIRRS